MAFNTQIKQAVLVVSLLTLLSPTLPAEAGRRASATYYHPSLAGRIKANGRPYNPNAMTAASNHYRLGTRVRVTNPANGKSVTVTITDRCGNCSIDLSSAAFQRIAPLRQGRVSVRVTKL